MNGEGKLRFLFLQGDSILEARVKNGFYHVGYINDTFFMSSNFLQERRKIDWYPNIYDALEAANKDYNQRKGS